MRIFFFFYKFKKKKKSQALSCKEHELQPSPCSGILFFVSMLFEYNLLVHLPFFDS